MSILFKKTIKAQTGAQTGQIPAEYWRQQMSDQYDKHLSHMNSSNATMDRDSPYYETLQHNPIYQERQRTERGSGMPGGWNYDRQSFRPGYFKDYYNEGYYTNQTNSPEQLSALHKQYNTPIPGAKVKTQAVEALNMPAGHKQKILSSY